MTIIGVSGLAGSGKDAVADFILQDHPGAKLGLADPMKRICREVFDFSVEQLWGPSENRNAPDKRYPRDHGGTPCACCGWAPGENIAVPTQQCYLTPRYALQRLGTEWARDCYKDSWVALAIRTAKLLLSNPDAGYSQEGGVTRRTAPDPIGTIVIPDIRHRNEIDALREAGGLVFRVVRPGGGLKVGGTHTSELEMADIPDDFFQAVIVNDGTLEDLQAKVREAMSSV